jgi:acyl-CoA thioesterase I
VRDQDDRRSRFTIERFEELDDPPARVAVEVTRRLVREENARSVSECACDRHPLLLAPGQLCREVIEPVAEADALQDVRGTRGRGILAAQLERYLHILDGSQRGNQLKALEHEPDLLAAKPGPRIFVEPGNIRPIQVHGAAGGRVEPGEQSEKGRLAASRRTHDRHELPLVDRERDVPKDYEAMIPALIFFGEPVGRKHMRIAVKILVLPVAIAMGCARDKAPVADSGSAQASTSTDSSTAAGNTTNLARPAAESRVKADAKPRILFAGTSLTAGLGLDPENAYPALIQRKVDSAGLNYEVVNGGLSGETSAGLLGRLDWLLREPYAIIVVETGANDGLRGIPVDAMRNNIQRILEKVRAKSPDSRLVLVQMEAMPNLGKPYTEGFHEVFPELARRFAIPLLPFLLDKVAGVRALNQGDGMHPNEEGERIVADNVWKGLRPLLK